METLKTNELEKPEAIREKMPVTGSCWKSEGCKKSCRKTFFQPAEVGLSRTVNDPLDYENPEESWTTYFELKTRM